MSKILSREKAIKLRLAGQTYSQIRKTLDVPKSTLSNWLGNLELSKETLRQLQLAKQKSRDLAVEKYRRTRRLQRIEKRRRIYEEQSKILPPLTERELLLMGLFLYWGEGDKKHGNVAISNTDSRIVKFSLYWMLHGLKIPKERIKVQLHLYKDMNIEESMNYWSNLLGIPQGQFFTPYVKKTNREGLTYKSFGHGTCKLYHGSVELSERIAMSIKAIAEYYGAKNELFWYN